MPYTAVLVVSIIPWILERRVMLFTAYGRVLFSYLCHYLWMCVMGELLLFPRLWIPSHVQYRARLGCITELPLCLAPYFGICLSFWAVSSYWFLVPLHLHLLTQMEIALFSHFICICSVVCQGWHPWNQNHCQPHCQQQSIPRGWGGHRDCISLTTPCAPKAPPWAELAGEGRARSSYSPLNLPG